MVQEYFSHDVFTRENLKIKKLISKHGMQGYGVFWAIVEFLHNNDNKLKADELGIIAFDLGVDIGLVESVVKDFKFFSIRKNVISSQRVARNIKLKKEKSEKARKKANKRWTSISDDAAALPQQCSSNAIKVNESKVNESKVNESKEKGIKEDESIEKETKKDEIKTEEIKNQTDENFNNSIPNTELNQHNSPTPTGNGQQFFNFYGTANNVHLTEHQYNSMCDMYGKELTDTVISELSYKIAVGKEQAFNAESPNLHLLRLERYAKQKIATTGTAYCRAKADATQSKSPSGMPAQESTGQETKAQTSEMNKGVPPPPEFFEAGERLRRMIKQRSM